MTLQEVFDKVVQHARTQGKQAITSRGQCRYRTPDGLKCFIGALIPDEVYGPDMERMRVCALMEIDPDISRMFEGINPYQLDQLQRIHDEQSPDRWEGYLQSYAIRWGLKYTAPASEI